MTRQIEWIHPSVRDTVIEYLMDHEVERGAFIKSATANGLAMSMSSAGGAQGARVFPLLRTGGDWALLREALARIGRTLDPAPVSTLATTLREALDAPGISEGQLHDLHESVVVFLRAVIIGSEDQDKALTLEALTRFYGLSDAVGVFVPSPSLDGLWRDALKALDNAISQDLDSEALARAMAFPRLMGVLEHNEPRYVRINLDDDAFEVLESRLTVVVERRVGALEDLDAEEDVEDEDEEEFVPVEPDGSEGEEMQWLTACESFLDLWCSREESSEALTDMNDKVREHLGSRQARRDRFEEWDAGRHEPEREPEGYSDEERPFNLSEFFADL